ncbi:hypothetical protein DBZ36_08505 [Alginatibacterium sediminis]|uniref:DUF218 domain-containing protein n=1 Tax=Alginatibacterium sediminis TaxID=2164068 RepID=A0A420ECP7_9ALTE|nr:ElyC/SanA/YdcF family protein [Alginatibacterium sediminis]RKF18446.1 hypothetical protein DBZ36_08505 [Alginatibacterium sediminis]
MVSESIYYSKQLLGSLLMPSSLLFLLIISCLYLLYRERYKAAKRRLLLTITLMYLFSTGMIGGHLLGYWEHKYAPLVETGELDYIVVLGGYHNLARGEVLTNALNDSSARRIVEALRLAQLSPNAKIVFSGGMPDKFGLSHAQYMAKAAALLGVDPLRTRINDMTLDTADEARRFKLSYGSSNLRFALVSDASHIPRAMRLFQAQGLDPIAAPCNYKTASNQNRWNRHAFWPRASHLVNLRTAWYETLGNAWVWLSLNFFPAKA